MPKETAPDDCMGDSAGDDDARAGTGGGATSDNGAAAAGAGGAEAGRVKRNTELSELSSEERLSLWSSCSGFEDFAAKLEELYVAKRARHGRRASRCA
eukprot:1917304-Pyramimonas_sp.AAC.1